MYSRNSFKWEAKNGKLAVIVFVQVVAGLPKGPLHWKTNIKKFILASGGRTASPKTLVMNHDPN